MSIKLSTGLRNYMLDTGSLNSALAAGFVDIYSGAVPVSADDAIVSGTLLVTVSLNSTATGVNFDTAAAAGVITKAPLETWSGVCAAGGVASYFRYRTAADTGNSSATAFRIQGNIGLAGSDMNMSNTLLVTSAAQTIDIFALALPTL